MAYRVTRKITGVRMKGIRRITFGFAFSRRWQCFTIRLAP